MVVPFAAIAQSSSPAPDRVSQDTVDVQHLMAAYHEAVVTHDGARLASLFIPQGSTWLNVLSDSGLAHMRASKPGTVKIRVGNYQDFAKIVSQSKAHMDPQHQNVRILSDGTIASVYFDYVFMVDGKPNNSGSEAWQLVKGENGWRIAAITYSSNPAPK
ncbi:nuclear transport factor 2 family protein [Dyella monticola]|uniref:Nuclear transport factor 2 family protein n=2 Tax=Dyella monticola TaxID=1927958 RepID=A0A370X6M6_9GAMM|nr:nuclear transport factor 2 family protein [Dyella monticola]